MKKCLFSVLLILFASTVVLASGFSIYEQGAKATGMGGAFAAQANDASALFYNPAGIAFLKKCFYFETTIISPDSKFYGANPYPGIGNSESQRSQTFLPSDIAIIMPLNKNWVFGIGVYTPFGLSVKWKNPSEYSGRFVSTIAKVDTFRIQPTIAYAPNNKFSVAFGVNYLSSKVALEKYIPAVDPYTQSVVNVGHVRIDGGTDGAWGYDLGVLFRYIPKISLGFTYHSEEDIDYSGRAMFDQIKTGHADFDQMVAQQIPFGQKLDGASTINFPEQAIFGVSTTVIPKCTFEFDLSYAGWSSYDTLPIIIKDHPELSLTRNTNWDDNYSYRFGFEYCPTKQVALRLGYQYDETPQPRKEAGPVLPDSDRNGYCIGLGYNTGKITLDASYMYLKFDDFSNAGLDQVDHYYGSYDTHVHLVGLSLKYNF